MKFVMEVELDNADFKDPDDQFTSGFYLSKLLVGVAVELNEAILEPGMVKVLFDSNGNKVGRYDITGS